MMIMKKHNIMKGAAEIGPIIPIQLFLLAVAHKPSDREHCQKSYVLVRGVLKLKK